MQCHEEPTLLAKSKVISCRDGNGGLECVEAKVQDLCHNLKDLGVHLGRINVTSNDVARVECQRHAECKWRCKVECRINRLLGGVLCLVSLGDIE